MEDTSKYYVVRKWGNRKGSAGGKFDDGWMKTTIRELGTYTVAVDTVSPRVTPLNRSQWKSGNIQFKIGDAEIIRGGLNSITHGQFEAGHAQGFNVVQVMIYIILPQAYRNVIPTLLSQVITTIKDSSYLANVATIELMARTKQLLSAASSYNGTGNVNVSDVFVLFGMAALIYFIINYTLSCVVRSMQKRRKRPVRVVAE